MFQLKPKLYETSSTTANFHFFAERSEVKKWKFAECSKKRQIYAEKRSPDPSVSFLRLSVNAFVPAE
jgi:hypothetical protein